MTSSFTTSAPAQDWRAVSWAVGAAVWWGLSPVYFKAVRHVPATELVAHRIVWSVVVLAFVIAAARRGAEVRRLLGERRTIAALAASSLLLAGNWLTYVWAVNHEQLLEGSLGYFIYPLVNVALGVAVLGERLTRGEGVALALAVVGVAWLWLAVGVVPWIALFLACSFALYALVRKVVFVGSIEGLAIETSVLAPCALAYLVGLEAQGRGAVGSLGFTTDVLLASAGVVTTVPLVCFAVAVKRLRLTTIGVLSYVAPTLQFLLAVFVYGEPFGGAQLIACCFIWAALAVFTADNFARAARAPSRAAAAPAATAARRAEPAS